MAALSTFWVWAAVYASTWKLADASTLTLLLSRT